MHAVYVLLVQRAAFVNAVRAVRRQVNSNVNTGGIV